MLSGWTFALHNNKNSTDVPSSLLLNMQRVSTEGAVGTVRSIHGSLPPNRSEKSHLCCMQTAQSRALCQRLATEHQHGLAERGRGGGDAQRTAGKVHFPLIVVSCPKLLLPVGVWGPDGDSGGFSCLQPFLSSVANLWQRTHCDLRGSNIQ